MRIAFALAAVVALIGSVASAAPADQNLPQVVVSVRDLSLSKPHDVRALTHRLQAASLQVCGASDDSASSVIAATRQSACYKTALNAAMGEAQKAVLASRPSNVMVAR